MSAYKTLPIKDWDLADRPREKLMQHGIAALSDAELLAILLATGTKNLSAVDLAKCILQSVDNNLHLLGKSSIADLKKINGIGEAKAITILAALELGRRRKASDVQHVQVRSSADIAAIFQPVLGDLAYEEFWAVYLSRSQKILSKIKISMGGTAGTVIDTKIILKHALDQLASGIIVVHNHPSGNRQASSQDRAITKKIKTAAEFMDISLLDHIIIADKVYMSFADEGML